MGPQDDRAGTRALRDDARTNALDDDRYRDRFGIVLRGIEEVANNGALSLDNPHLIEAIDAIATEPDDGRREDEAVERDLYSADPDRRERALRGLMRVTRTRASRRASRRPTTLLLSHPGARNAIVVAFICRDCGRWADRQNFDGPIPRYCAQCGSPAARKARSRLRKPRT